MHGTAALESPGILPLPRQRHLRLGARPLVMGIVNVTPDSFSDGGRYLDPDRAVGHALALLDEGADLIDLGAESTRPAGRAYGAGAAAVDPGAEWRRLEPVLRRLRELTEAPISVDTKKGRVAELALAAGADLVNDVSALGDPEMGPVVAKAGCPVVLMHLRGTTEEMFRHAVYDDVVREVVGELAEAVDRAIECGIERNRIFVDPGLGFAKNTDHNLALLRELPAIRELGLPVVIGASRKSFIGEITDEPAGERLEGSLAAAGWAARHGAAMVRVHDVAATRRFLDVWTAIETSGADPR